MKSVGKMTRLRYSVHPILTQSIQVSISRRVGGDPPRTSFLAFGAKIGSSVGVKSHHFRVKIQIFAFWGDFLVQDF